MGPRWTCPLGTAVPGPALFLLYFFAEIRVEMTSQNWQREMTQVYFHLNDALKKPRGGKKLRKGLATFLHSLHCAFHLTSVAFERLPRWSALRIFSLPPIIQQGLLVHAGRSEDRLRPNSTSFVLSCIRDQKAEPTAPFFFLRV